MQGMVRRTERCRKEWRDGATEKLVERGGGATDGDRKLKNTSYCSQDARAEKYCPQDTNGCKV